MSVGGVGLFDTAGASASRAVADAAAERRDLEVALRRTHQRARNFQAAALSEPLTAAALQPLADQGWTILHDRRWPGSTRANVDHLAIGPGGVAVIDSKHWRDSVQIRDGRLWCGDDDRHDDTIETILRLTAAIQDLVIEVAGSDPGLDVGLSPIHVLPVLVFTNHARANTLAPRIGPVWLCTLGHLPLRLARRRCLAPAQVALLAEYLAREMPPILTTEPTEEPATTSDAESVGPTPPTGPTQRIIGVPISPRPAPPPSPEPIEPVLFDPAELAEALTLAAARPIADWMGFLHPSQARLVRRTFTGPARVRGPAGTGKTVVLLHRAAWLATIRPGRILVTSYVRTLPTQLSAAYQRLAPDSADKVDFINIHKLARTLLERNGQHYPVNYARVDRLYQQAWQRAGAGTVLERLATDRYWHDEIDHVIKGRGLRELAEYEALDRRGRELPLTNTHKRVVWELLHTYQDELDRAGAYDSNDQLSAALHLVTHQPPDPGWSAVLVDEVQDLSLLALKLCHALAGDGTDALFLVGDGQQALYPGGFSLADAGISVTGRAVVLRTNYRNTRQILDTAQQLVVHRDFTDLDTTTEPGRQPVTVLREGPPVEHEYATSRRGLILLLRQAIHRHARAGIPHGDMAVLCHTRYHLKDITTRLTNLGMRLTPLETWDGQPDPDIKIGTIHRAKGLDFAAVYLPDLGTTPPPGTDPGRELAEDTAWERDRAQREYVARTRPRDRLWIGRIRPPTSPKIASH